MFTLRRTHRTEQPLEPSRLVYQAFFPIIFTAGTQKLLFDFQCSRIWAASPRAEVGAHHIAKLQLIVACHALIQ
jgi:hypothetical protein